MKAIGKQIVGYRYGEAPANGYSWNHMDNKHECGVSMAQVGHIEELNSYAVLNLKEKKVKKHYYIGVIAGEGGDKNEICLIDLKKITYAEYKKCLKSIDIINTSNDIVDFLADRRIELINSGWNIGATVENIELWRSKNKR